jgi:TetR/AcrR family transcriptional regulator
MTAASPQTRRRRNPQASRRAILDAAEELFSARGYDGASLGEIGRRAGTSSALPAYFFGGKDGLYRAVLERLLAEREERLGPLAATASDLLERTGELRSALEVLIDGYIDFLREQPALVRLMAREALDGGRRLGPGPRLSVALQEGLTRFVRSLPAAPPGPSIDSEQLLITTVALCFFPIEHNDTMLAAMGLDAGGEHFSLARKRHVVDVLERILAGG